MAESKLVSVIVLAEEAPAQVVADSINNVIKQTYKNLDILVSHFKREDLSVLQERWKDVNNIRWIEVSAGIDLMEKPLKEVKGDYVFYKTTNPVNWFPRHIEHHMDLFRWDSKAEWSFSLTEVKNWAKRDKPFNILHWKIDKTPKPETTHLDELVHNKNFSPDWTKCLVSFDGGRSTQFMPGAVIDQLKNARVAEPKEITCWQWIDFRPAVNLGRPTSDQNPNEEVIELQDGSLGVKIEYPTVVGSVQWQEHNDLIYDRIREIDPSTVKSIAIKRTIGMGDVILVEPVIRALKKKYVNAKISFFTGKMRSAKDVVSYFESKPDEIKELDNEGLITQDYLYSQKGFDLRFDFDLAYESRRNVNYVDAYFFTAGFRDEVVEIDGKLTIQNPVPASERVPHLTYSSQAMLTKPYVTVELGGSGWGGKEWDLMKWENVLNDIRSKGFQLAFVSNSRLVPNFKAVNDVVVNEKNDFETMINWIRYSAFHIGADNGPMHVAIGFGKVPFVIAGAALPSFTSRGKVFEVAKRDLGCLHCKGRQYVNETDQGGTTFVARCENPNQYCCMKELETESVRIELEKFLATL